MAAPDMTQDPRVSDQKIQGVWSLLSQQLRKSPRLRNEVLKTLEILDKIDAEGMKPN